MERRVLEERRHTAALASSLHPRRRRQTSPPCLRPRPVQGALGAGAARPAPWTPRVGRCLAQRAARTRRERLGAGTARRFGACATTPRAVHHLRALKHLN